MVRKLKNNKGISLVEVLVSVAIIGIMIIPITNMVTTSIKTNKKSETRQYGMLLGEEVLEQIELMEYGKKYQNNIKQSTINLPSGDKLEGNNTEYDKLQYTMEKEIEGDKYLVEVNLDKNNSIQYNYGESADGNNENNKIIPDIILDLKRDSNEINSPICVTYGSKTYEIEPIIENNDTIKLELRVMNDSISNTKTITINEISIDIEGSNFNNKLMINLTNEYKSKTDNGLNIDVYNSINPKLELYIKRSYDCEERVYTNNKQGSLKVINNLRDHVEASTNRIHDFYNIKVEVSKNGKELFTGYGNRNLKINSASS